MGKTPILWEELEVNNFTQPLEDSGTRLHCLKILFQELRCAYFLTLWRFIAPIELIASLDSRKPLVSPNLCHTNLVSEQVHYLPLQVGPRVLHSFVLHFESNSRLEPIWSAQQLTVCRLAVNRSLTKIL